MVLARARRLEADRRKVTRAMPPRARLIAFFLPQFHPIAENDEWWEPGFTEWTNVTRARKLFRGHEQPRVPADLGYYDLRVPETRERQARMAVRSGIEAFCYWHYWFAGRRVLERPFNEVLSSGEPRLPFCLGWANDSWTGIWHGSPDRILIEQSYPGPDDERRHFEAVLPAFSDPRYLTVDGKPLFLVYKPYRLPEPERFTEHWQNLAIRAGLKGVYFVAHVNDMRWPVKQKGFDALVPHNPGITTHHVFNRPILALDRYAKRMTGSTATELFWRMRGGPRTMDYREYVRLALPTLPFDVDAYPCVVPNWDNTARCGRAGYVLTNSTPALFRHHLQHAIDQVRHRPLEKRIIFIKSWNEWGEGNYMEPDVQYGQAYLEVSREEVGGVD
jgi:lipopolysaccharide biosynthesis protein